MAPIPGYRVDAWDSALFAEISLQLDHVTWKGVGGARVAPHCGHRVLIRSGGPSQAEVDSARVHRLECAKLLGDRERRVIRQHYPTGPETDLPGLGADVGDQHAGGRRSN